LVVPNGRVLRIRIIFSLKNRGAWVPFHHQYLIAQVIRGVLVTGGDKARLDFTRFNFSGLKGQTKVSRKGLHYYSSRVTLVFSTSDAQFLEYFVSNLFAQKEVMVGNLQLVPESVENEDPVEIGEAVKYLCISPIVLLPGSFNDDRAKRFISPETDEFSDSLYESTLARMEASGQYPPDQLAGFFKFQLIPDKDYLFRIQSSHKKFARIYPLFDQDIKFEVRGYTFPFTLYAAREVQKFVYENGIGYFSHKGFGMLDVSGSNPVKQPPDYEHNYA
jgi:CRISPR-associated endoribonuclease Cas6